MILMTDVLDQKLVQNFIHSLSMQNEQYEELIEGIMTASNVDFCKAIQHFLSDNNTTELAEALDINHEHIHAIQSGLALAQENIANTAKIVALCLAIETDSLDKVEVSDSLVDFII